MLGAGFIKERVFEQDVEFVEKLESNLKLLPPEIQIKLKKLNFFSDAYDISDNASVKENLKKDIIELLNEFIKEDYHPIFVGQNIGFYLYSEKMPLPRLPVFVKIYNPQDAQTTPKTLLPTFSTLSSKAKPFIPKSQNSPVLRSETSPHLSISG